MLLLLLLFNWQAINQLSSWMSMYFCMKTFLSKHQKIFRAYSSFNIHHDPKNTAFFSDGNQCLSSKQGHCQLTVLRILLYCCSENASWSNTVSAGKKNQTLQWDLSLKQKGVVENSSLTYCCGLSCPFCSRIPRFLGNAFISNIAAYSFKKEKISWGHDMYFCSWDLFWTVFNKNT